MNNIQTHYRTSHACSHCSLLLCQSLHGALVALNRLGSSLWLITLRRICRRWLVARSIRRISETGGNDRSHHTQNGIRKISKTGGHDRYRSQNTFPILSSSSHRPSLIDCRVVDPPKYFIMFRKISELAIDTASIFCVEIDMMKVAEKSNHEVLSC